MHRTCGARTRSGGFCKKLAVHNSLRCRLHGALAGRPRGTPMHPNTAAAIAKGKRWALEQRRKLKAAGQVDRVWGGSRRAKGLPPLSKHPKVRKAQRLVEARMAERKRAALVAVPGSDPPVLPAERPWTEMSKGEKLAAATDRALDVAKAHLDQPVDPGNVKLA